MSVNKITYLQHEKGKNDSIQLNIRNEVNYTLRSGDLISIKVFSTSSDEYNFLSEINSGSASSTNPELNGFSINNNGEIELPHVGAIVIKDLTVNEAEAKIQEELNSFLKSPIVKITPLNFYVTILGEARAPGRIVSFRKNLTLFEAIGLAGDLTDYADRKHIKLTRFEGQVSTTYTIDLTQIDVLESELLYLKAGDLITIPPLKAKVFKLYNSQNVGFVLSVLSIIVLATNIISQ